MTPDETELCARLRDEDWKPLYILERERNQAANTIERLAAERDAEKARADAAEEEVKRLRRKIPYRFLEDGY